MEQKFERFLKLLSDMDYIQTEDALAKMINAVKNSELTEAELDNVSAASKPDYEKFLKRLNHSE